MRWIYLAPDYSREPVPRPEHPLCESCFRKVDPSKAVRVETSRDYPKGVAPEMSARESASGQWFVGPDCWKRLSAAEFNPNRPG